MRVVVAGGGTGGHIYPALALAEGIQSAEAKTELLFVGLKEGMEARLVPENGWSFKGIAGRGMPRKIRPAVLMTLGSTIKALWQAKNILKDFHPDLVVGTGGFVSGPVLLVAAFFGIPTLLHEQNVWPGMTNKMLARHVKKVMLAFEEGRAHFPASCATEVVGQPVRPRVGHADREEALKIFQLAPGKKVLLVTGGSRGARSINRAMTVVAQKLQSRDDIQLIWATGTLDYEEALAELERGGVDPRRKGWHIAAYIEDMPHALALADLCVCRAGATTLAELSAAGLPSILIPYPFAAENHQEFNARAMVEGGAARMIIDKEMTGKGLWEQVEKLLGNTFALEEMAAQAGEAMRRDALGRIVEICLATAWR